MIKISTLDITCKCLNRIFSDLPYVKALLTSSILYIYHFHLPGLWLRVSGEQNFLASFSCTIFIWSGRNVTLRRSMSLSALDGHFHVFFFRVSESQFCALYNGENHFQIRELVAELHAFEYGGTAHGTLLWILEIFMWKLSIASMNPSKFSAFIG